MAAVDRDYMKSEGWQREQRGRLAAWQWRKLGYRRVRATPRRRLVRYGIVAALALAPGAALGYAAGADLGPFAPEPLLVWGGESFTSKADFRSWLSGRGVTYAEWAANHPVAAAKLERRTG